MKRNILKVVALSLLVSTSFVLLTNLSSAQSSRSQNNITTTTQVAPQEKTSGQVRKNIKVLSSMPQSQFFPAMIFIAGSLGVQCDFCHVSKNGQLDYASDDKPEKQTAREMIKMVLYINKTYAQANAEVSCYTCHRGRTSPQGFPNLPLQQWSPRPSPSAPGTPVGAGAAVPSSPRATPVLPSADDIIKKYIAVIGGQAAIDRIKNCVIKGTRATSSGFKGAYETEEMTPDKGYESLATSAGTVERAVNGATGWEKSSDGVREFVGQQVADQKLSFQLFMNLMLKDQYSSMRVSDNDKIGERDVFVVNATRNDNKPERLYFDAANGLLLRRISYTRTMIGIIPQQTDFEDYREVEGVKFPFTVRVSTVDPRNPITVRTLEEIRLNISVDDSRFSKPAVPQPNNR